MSIHRFIIDTTLVQVDLMAHYLLQQAERRWVQRL